jgi:hypothetical protein
MYASNFILSYVDFPFYQELFLKRIDSSKKKKKERERLDCLESRKAFFGWGRGVVGILSIHSQRVL